MNTINFAEARETLSKLETYINQKNQKEKNPTSQDTDMNLASQPEIASDHLGEEATLTPVVETQLDATPMSEVSPMPTNEAQLASPVEESQPSPIMPGVPEGMGVSMDTNQPVSQPSPTISGVSVEMGASLDTIQSVNQPMKNQSQLLPQSDASSTTKLEEMPSTLVTESNEPGLESIPAIDLSGSIDQDASTENLSLETNQNDEGYKAMANNATVNYSTSEPTPIPTPVVMPNGMPQDMNSSDSMVVGPEAFNITR